MRKLRSGTPSVLALLCLLALASCARGRATALAQSALLVRDTRLEMTLFAADPLIVTPIGIAVDGADRVFVLESHTHSPPAGYTGPKSDRVRVLTDADGDGAPETTSTFADGLDDGMNLAFSPGGALFVVTSRAVWALHDRDRDGISEARTRVLAMVRPERVYDHAGLLGLAFSPDGWLYVSRGNTGGAAWRVEGTDGSALTGYGDGGNIMRSRPDGRHLEEVATGFWNPFDLKFDQTGRLLAIDNDPDSRGPNRLVDVIRGGDYGYKSLYGGSGIHPYQSWNGELPGTLPYAAALGEAPAGLFLPSAGILPADFLDGALVSIWEERKIVRVRLEPRGVSVAGAVTALVEGDEQFRPVAFAADTRGSIYVTDWARREYPNHSKGRIWRVRSRRDVPAGGSPGVRATAAGQQPAAGLHELYTLDGNELGGFERLRRALSSSDPFLRSAAVTQLALPAFREQLISATVDRDAKVRLGALLALERSRDPRGEQAARRLLEDPDEDVRRMALVWAGRAGFADLRAAIDRAITTGPPSAELFALYLATLEQIDPQFIDAHRRRAAPYAGALRRALPHRFLESFVEDRARPRLLRITALRQMRDLAGATELLLALTQEAGAPELRLEAVRSLAGAPSSAAAPRLLALAQDRTNPPALRAEALLALARQPIDAGAEAIALLDDEDADIRLEAARYLRGVKVGETRRAEVSRRQSTLTRPADANAREQLARITGPRSGASASAGSSQQLASGGNPGRGRRVFFSSQSSCAHCHAWEGRGGDLGPALTHVGLSKTRQQILESILRPDAEISPEYQGWYVKAADGTIHTGRQIDVGDAGKADLYVLPGRFATFENIKEYGVLSGSLMPAGLESNLTPDDLRDLLAFLEGARK